MARPTRHRIHPSILSGNIRPPIPLTSKRIHFMYMSDKIVRKRLLGSEISLGEIYSRPELEINGSLGETHLRDTFRHLLLADTFPPRLPASLLYPPSPITPFLLSRALTTLSSIEPRSMFRGHERDVSRASTPRLQREYLSMKEEKKKKKRQKKKEETTTKKRRTIPSRGELLRFFR